MCKYNDNAKKKKEKKLLNQSITSGCGSYGQIYAQQLIII